MFKIENDGEILTQTDFWQSQESVEGKMFLTWSSNVARLLVPEVIKERLFTEISLCESVEIEEESDKVCLYFYDNQPSPFKIMIAKDMTDAIDLTAGEVKVAVYIEAGMKYEVPAEVVI